MSPLQIVPHPHAQQENAGKRPTLGEQETDLLRFVAGHCEPISVGEAESGWGDPAGLSRSTVKTILNRLHNKGYLERVRRPGDGVFAYRSPVAERELLGSLVQRFVERTLAGSLDPFLAYFARTGMDRLSPGEFQELERIVQKLQPPVRGNDTKDTELIP